MKGINKLNVSNGNEKGQIRNCWAENIFGHRTFVISNKFCTTQVFFFQEIKEEQKYNREKCPFEVIKEAN